MTSILVINGPNLNLLGQRQPEIYGRATLEDVEALCAATAEQVGLTASFMQSNHEGAIIDALHLARTEHAGVVLNAGGYSHTSVAIHDAIISCEKPTVEVHVSNIHARESFRHKSLITPAAIGIISGFGVQGYALAVRALATYLANASS